MNQKEKDRLSQKNFEVLIKGLIEHNALPNEIIIYSYYRRAHATESFCISYSFDTAAPHIKNDVSRLALLGLNDKEMAENTIGYRTGTISTYAVAIENQKPIPLSAEDLCGITMVIGLKIFQLDSPIITGKATQESFNRYFIGSQLVDLKHNIREMRKVVGYGS